MSNDNVGIINEQGFVAGNGLGFNPINEKDLYKNSEDNENKEEDK